MWSAPQMTDVIPGGSKPLITVGTSRSSASPWPSCPSSPLPHVHSTLPAAKHKPPPPRHEPVSTTIHTPLLPPNIWKGRIPALCAETTLDEMLPPPKKKRTVRLTYRGGRQSGWRRQRRARQRAALRRRRIWPRPSVDRRSGLSRPPGGVN